MFDEYREARDSGIRSRPVIPGPFTLLGLLKSTGSTSKTLVAEALVRAYVGILEGLDALECEWVQIDEPQLVTDIEDRDIGFSNRFTTSCCDTKVDAESFCKPISATFATLTTPSIASPSTPSDWTLSKGYTMSTSSNRGDSRATDPS